MEVISITHAQNSQKVNYFKNRFNLKRNGPIVSRRVAFIR